MTDLDELARLETERDRIRSMIAYHHGPFYQAFIDQTLYRLVAVVVVIVGAAGAFFIAGALAALAALLFLIPAAYILTPPKTLFDGKFRLADVPAGEPEALQRLADCEARITQLKQGQP
jgi:hypothetical protein